MSFSRNDRILRVGRGKGFPMDPGADVEAAFASVIADALRKDFGDAPAHVKHIARLTGANARTVQNWLQARNGPSGAGLVVLMRHSDEVTAAVLKLSDRERLREGAVAAMMVADLRKAVLAVLPYLPEE